MNKILLLTFLIYCTFANGQVTLNEMQSSNSFTYSDEVGEFDDWIEIHNPTSDSIEISGLILKDQIDIWVIPSGDPSTQLPPDGYFLLWADDQEFQGLFHTNFKLASGGEFLGLYESDGFTVIDSITIPAMAEDDSYVRCDDEWTQTSYPTPLVINDCPIGLAETTNFNDLFSITRIGNNQLQISVHDYYSEQRILRIYSIDGKEIAMKALESKNTTLDLNILPNNIYIASILTPNYTYVKKILFVE